MPVVRAKEAALRINDHVRLSSKFQTSIHQSLRGALVHEVWDVSNRGSFYVTCDNAMPVFDDRATVTTEPLTCLRCVVAKRYVY